MMPYPYSIECETLTPTTRSWIRAWFPTPEAAAKAQAQAQREAEGWQRVDMVAPGQIPGASVTGRQVLACGGRNLPRRRRTKGGE